MTTTGDADPRPFLFVQDVSEDFVDIDRVLRQVNVATEAAKTDLNSKTKLLDLGHALDSFRKACTYFEIATLATDNEGPRKVNALINLGNLLYFRSNRYNLVEPLNEAIDRYKRALAVAELNHSTRLAWLYSLANICTERYNKSDKLQYLQEAITVYQKFMLGMKDVDGSMGYDLLKIYGVVVDLCNAKYRKTDNLEDIKQAISIGHTNIEKFAMEFPPPQNHVWAVRVIDLSKAWQASYRVTRNTSDLDNALSRCQQAINLTSQQGKPFELKARKTVEYMGMMFWMLINKFEITEEATIIERAISFCAMSCEMSRETSQHGETPTDRRRRAIILRNWSHALMIKYESVTEAISDLKRAVSVCEQALDNKWPLVLIPELDYSYSRMLLHMYERTRENEYLVKARMYAQLALKNTLPADLDRKTYLDYYIQVVKLTDLERDQSIEQARQLNKSTKAISWWRSESNKGRESTLPPSQSLREMPESGS